MNHRAEIALHQYLEKVVNGKGGISDVTSFQISKDVYDAIVKQFGHTKSKDFRLRMSNVGRPYCQLWFEKNKPETALPKPTTFVMNMLLGDIVEAVFKGLLKEAGVEYKDSDSVALDLEDASIKGTYDIAIDGSVDDIKSASDWSFKHKFESFDTLKDGDAFGYIGQLAGYAKASGLKAGGWWVINKANGDFKYVPANTIDVETEVNKIQNIYSKLKINKFERCFEAEVETFRGKPTGNKVLGTTCGFCDYRYACWPTLQELPAVKSQAKQPKIIKYVELAQEYR
tara:strand:- start:149 stop:1003 length:855 start_codon:yes stop_codon:yes gene_type:complete